MIKYVDDAYKIFDLANTIDQHACDVQDTDNTKPQGVVDSLLPLLEDCNESFQNYDPF